MKEKEFKQWLKEYGFNDHVAGSRLSNIKRVEEAYPDIDNRIANNTIDEVLSLLSYSAKDEKAGRPTRHNIAINGNLRTGTATLKSALNLYIQFYNEKYHPESVDSTPFKILFNRIMEIVNEFAKQEKSKRKESYNKKEVVTERLQEPLLNLLQKEISGVEWESEHVYRKETKDRIDIYGVVNENEDDNGKSKIIIIELDTARSDQVSKKFVSRMAMTNGHDTIYITFCYPNNNSASKSGKSETEKYSRFLQTLNDALNEGSDNEKYYGYISMA